MNDVYLPNDLLTFIGSEKTDFAVKAKRKQPLKKSLAMIGFGTVWTAFTSIFVIAMFGPLLKGEEVHFSVNKVPTVASLDNFEPMLVPSLIIGLFVLIGLGMLFYGIFSVFQKGGYFVGTSSRLIQFNKGTVQSIDWEQFSGNIEVKNSNESGNISLQLRTGKMVSTKNGPDRFVPDIIYISGIPNVFEIEGICRKRIKENDPTPPNIG